MEDTNQSETASLVQTEKKKSKKKNKDHALLAPSSAKRWLACPGSICLGAKCPPQPDSIYAKEGTFAHSMAEKILSDWLLNDYDILEAHEKHRKQFPSKEMEEHVLDYCTAIVRYMMGKNVERVGVERKFCLDKKLGIWGTADFAMIHKPAVGGGLRFGVIFDLKYGQGVPVEVKDNEQLFAYACAMAATPKWECTHVDVFIFQPRCEHPDGPLRYVRVMKSDIEAWTEKFIRGGRLALDQMEAQKPTFKVGEHCRFCKAEAICVARADYLRGSVDLDFTDKEQLPAADLAAMTDSQIKNIVLNRAEIEKFLKRVEEHAVSRFLARSPIRGLKLVHGRASRKWVKDDAMVAHALERMGVKEPFEKSLIGITEAERQVGKGKLDELTVKHEPSLKIVSVDDPRAEVMPAVDAAVLDFNENEEFD